METSSLTLHGDAAERVPETLVEETATVGARSINKLGVDNVHRYRGDGMTLLAYEQSAAYREAWVMVAILFEPVDETTSRAVVLVGGGREGPFRIRNLEQRLDRWVSPTGQPVRTAGWSARRRTARRVVSGRSSSASRTSARRSTWRWNWSDPRSPERRDERSVARPSPPTG